MLAEVLFPKAPITILFPPSGELSNCNKFDFTNVDVSNRNYFMWIQDVTRHLTTASSKIIVASYVVEELNKPPPLSLFEELCLKHIKWKYLTNEDSMAL